MKPGMLFNSGSNSAAISKYSSRFPSAGNASKITAIILNIFCAN
jgi:hypothetical protein